MQANRHVISKYERSRRGRDGDYRRKGAWLVVSYIGENGEEYRRASWDNPGTDRTAMFDKTPRTIEVPA